MMSLPVLIIFPFVLIFFTTQGKKSENWKNEKIALGVATQSHQLICNFFSMTPVLRTCHTYRIAHADLGTSSARLG
jgi:hypothetical protein